MLTALIWRWPDNHWEQSHGEPRKEICFQLGLQNVHEPLIMDPITILKSDFVGFHGIRPKSSSMNWHEYLMPL